MNCRTKLYLQAVSVAAFLSAASTSAFGVVEPGKWETPETWFIYLVILVVLLGSFLTMMIIRRVLKKSKWSLADALSEEYEVTPWEEDPTTKSSKPMLDETKKAILIKEMRASTSRLIALMGMMVILLMFIGFGVIALYAFARTGNMPDSIDKVVNFLVAGLTLFAPYVVNKFSNIFGK